MNDFTEAIKANPPPWQFAEDSDDLVQHRSGISRRGLANAAANILLAGLFFMSAFAPNGHRDFSAANVIWSVGAALMALFSLVRSIPKATMVNLRSIAATAGMMIIPTMAVLVPPSTGLTHTIGLIVEFVGVTFTQIARIYLGRSFGLLPANRGIVSGGPFRLMRHPVYAGWLLLTIGYAICYPSAFNTLINIAVLPFMMWRIEQEEEVLMADSDYRVYCAQVTSQLIPGLL